MLTKEIVADSFKQENKQDRMMSKATATMLDE